MADAATDHVTEEFILFADPRLESGASGQPFADYLRPGLSTLIKKAPTDHKIKLPSPTILTLSIAHSPFASQVAWRKRGGHPFPHGA